MQALQLRSNIEPALDSIFALGTVCALVRATNSFGRVTITAAVEGLPPATINLQTAPLAREDRMIAYPAENERGF